jgi:hypothetical protein
MSQKSTYNAILIDPFTKSFSTVAIPKDDDGFKQIYSLLSCSLVDTVSVSFGAPGDRIVIDDEGNYKEDQKAFYVDGIKLSGKALYVGNRGDSFDTPEITIDELSEKVSFNGDAFRKWLETFLDEKDIDLEHNFNYKSDDNFAIISLAAIVERACMSDASSKEKIKNIIVEIDFRNGDVLHFFKFLGEQMAKEREDY